jgi:glucose dehydrogenase
MYDNIILAVAKATAKAVISARNSGPWLARHIRAEEHFLKHRLLSATIAILFFGPFSAFPVAAQSDWTAYGHDAGQTKYSPLDQINTNNVDKLTPAWVYHMKPVGPASEIALPSGNGGKARVLTTQATPLIVNGMMYVVTPYNSVIALTPESGELIWIYKLEKSRLMGRSLAYWAGDKKTPASLFFGTGDGRLMSLNAKTGKLTAGFGENGTVNLKVGMIEPPHQDGRYNMTSAPSIYKNLVISGAAVQEDPARGASGDVRAWDVHTGKLVWRFHSIPQPGEVGHDSWPADAWEGRSGANVWGFSSVDTKRGLVFLPFGSPTSDFWGADRAGNDLFGNTLVVLHAKTGKLAWYFQAVHHDINDYDLESAPVMIDVRHDGKNIPAVALTSKTGLMFILDRRNGKPIYGVEERPIPQSTIPGEHSSPTQPFPLKPVQLGRSSFTPADLSTVTPEHHAFCEKMLATEGGMQGGPMFTPYGPNLTIIFPSTVGVVNWHGMSYNPKLGYLFVNTNELGSVGKVAPTAQGTQPPYNRTSPWGMYAEFTDQEKHWPCQQPPWGQMWAINVNTGDVAWKVPFGTIPELDAKGIHNTGSMNYGGSISTGGGLVFIAASNDQHFRALEAATGKTLWDIKMDTGAYVTPSTFMGKDGRQYVVIVDTGGGFFDHTNGDSILSFALPK